MKKVAFISSTYEDMKEYRKRVWDILTKYNVNIRGMEQFGARKEAPLQTCLAEVEQCDIFICIIGARLGVVDSATAKSIVQLEYEKAMELEKDVLIYFLDEKNGKIEQQYVDFGENHEKLKAFKSILKERHTIDKFCDVDDLAVKLKRKFDDLFSKKEKETPPNDTAEYEKSSSILTNFLLFPKAYSGNEVKLKIKIEGWPFPASKALCSSFGFEYGKTIGISIKLIEPKMDKEEPFSLLFVNYQLAEKIINSRTKEVDVYACPMFTGDTIENIRAYFVSQTVYSYPVTAVRQSTFASIFGVENPLGEMQKTIPAEGKIILYLREFASARTKIKRKAAPKKK